MKFVYFLSKICLAFAFWFIFLSINSSAQTLTARPNVSMTSNSHGYYEYLPFGYDPAGSKTYPVLIAFGGLSQNGDGTSAQLDYVFSNWGGPGWQIKNGKFPSSLTVNSQVFRFIVILPQFSSSASPKGVDDVISYIIAHYKADASRIYLTGNSSGGGYCWDYPGSSIQYGKRVAAVVPTCAAASYNSTKANNIAAANLPVWATHNAVDAIVSPYTTINFVNGINAAPVPPTPLAKKTIFQDEGHNCADSTFNMTYGIGAYAWMLKYKRGTTTANQPPVAKAGNDVTVTLPTNSVQLNGSGSSDPDGTITYSWSKIAGPTQFTINNSAIVNPVFSNLVAGTYTLRLKVTDNKGATATDDINIIVNQPPVAKAGSDIVITLPTSSVTVAGSGTDPDGTIASYKWTQVSGPSVSTIGSPATAKTTISSVVQGTYIFKLKVTDNKGATASDQMLLTVNAATVATGTKYINVNLYGGSNPYNNTAWNNWNVGTAYASNITSGLFKYSDGTSSGVKSVLSYSQAVGDNASNYGGGMAPAEVLRYTSDGQLSRTLTLSGLSTSLQYSLELYASRWSINNSTIFTLNGTSVTISTYYNFTNKAVFTNITPNAQGQIVINIQSLTSYNYLNGFMITQQSNTTTTAAQITQAISNSSNNAEITNGVISVEVFPNPITDNVVMQVTNPLSGIMKVEVINANGAVKKQLILKHASPVSNVNIPVSELPAGAYIIKVQIGKWSVSKKIIKS